MPIYENIAHNRVMDTSVFENIGMERKRLVGVWENISGVPKRIYISLGAVQNVRVTRDIFDVVSYTAWSDWETLIENLTRSSLISANDAISELNSFVNSLYPDTNTSEFRLVDVESFVTMSGYRASGDLQQRTRQPVANQNIRYTLRWEAPLIGEFDQYRIDRVDSGDSIVRDSSITTYTVNSNRTYRVRAENTATGVEGPWSDYVSYP